MITGLKLFLLRAQQGNPQTLYQGRAEGVGTLIPVAFRIHWWVHYYPWHRVCKMIHSINVYDAGGPLHTDRPNVAASNAWSYWQLTDWPWLPDPANALRYAASRLDPLNAIRPPLPHEYGVYVGEAYR